MRQKAPSGRVSFFSRAIVIVRTASGALTLHLTSDAIRAHNFVYEAVPDGEFQGAEFQEAERRHKDDQE
ncbi:hypothetical protein QG37_02975 [Candidozyma auris]|uniref:Uncharacterized protein n=1 Tax=Candidozyma auris TaxID=498019 RepID=A0A0L0P189_CANAR|nr:hypothetical protein QG37_02975 [[Candida] auris]